MLHGVLGFIYEHVNSIMFFVSGKKKRLKRLWIQRLLFNLIATSQLNVPRK